MGCVSAGGRNSGNVKLQGSPLWRIKAHDSQTRAIASREGQTPQRAVSSPTSQSVRARCPGQHEEAGLVCVALRASCFSLRKTRVWPVSDRLSLQGQKTGLGDG